MDRRTFDHLWSISHSQMECLNQAAVIVGESRIRGLRPFRAAEEFDYTLYFKFERSFAVGCDLTVSLRPEPAPAKDGGDNRRLRDCRVVCEIGWSACGREVPEALAAVALYREVVELAADVQTTLERMRPAMKWTLDDEKK